LNGKLIDSTVTDLNGKTVSFVKLSDIVNQAQTFTLTTSQKYGSKKLEVTKTPGQL